MARYSYADVVRRINRKVTESGVPLKAIQLEAGFTKDKWSKATRSNPTGTGGTKSSFTLEEIGRVAEYFHAPPGWPFIEWDIAESLDRALRALADRPPSRGASPAAATPGRRKGTGGGH